MTPAPESLTSAHLRGEPEMSNPELTMIIPAHNERGRIGEAIDALLKEWCSLSTSNVLEIVVVDDGSTDGTAEEAAQWVIKYPNVVRVVRLPENRGKGYAVRCGCQASRGRMVGFIDADLEYPVEAIPTMAEITRTQNACAVAVREVDCRPWHERWTSKLARVVVKWSLRLPVQDTQAGLKVFPGWFARDVIAHGREDGWLFDIEVLVNAKQQHLTIREVSVTQQRRRARRAGVGAMAACVPALGRIAWLRWRGEWAQWAQMLRFLMVGACNTACDILAFAGFNMVYPPNGRPVVAGIEAFLAWGAASLVAYPLHSRLTFRRQLPRGGFYVVTGLGVFTQVAVTSLVTMLFPHVPALWGKVLGIGLATGWTYTGYRWLAKRSPVLGRRNAVIISEPRKYVFPE
ncbi:MAG: bifunctional glycosyltransferase family 2/GtrA family protein [Firmicutes bacterium]|nr:bifunctional glycosyltransferase family 2/GtrA family protein [Bacillota bacterium]